MVTVNKSQFSLNGKTLVTEASTIGLPPGEWPDFIAVVDDANTGFLFGPEKKNETYGEDLTGVRYFSRVGSVELLVVND